MILVSGGAGFIGGHTVRALRAGGHDVRVLDDLSTGRREVLEGTGAELIVGSITDPQAVRNAMDGVSHVVHLAAAISVPESVADPIRYDHINVRGFLHVLMAAKDANVQRVAYASSCAVYGSVPGLPKHETDALAPESPYASSKLANEAYAASFAALGLPTVGLRYFNVFGPGQDPGGPYGAVIPTFVDRALRGEVLTVHGDGEQGRDFVSVYDVARANVAAALTDGPSGVVYNVGTGRMLTVNQIAQTVDRECGGVVVEHGPPRAGDVRFSRASIDRITEGLGWSPQEPFEGALAETVRGFRDREA